MEAYTKFNQNRFGCLSKDSPTKSVPQRLSSSPALFNFSYQNCKCFPCLKGNEKMQLLPNEVLGNFYKCVCRFYSKLSPDALRFCSRIFFDFLGDFFTLQFFIFSDLSCSRFEIKFVGKKTIVRERKSEHL